MGYTLMALSAGGALPFSQDLGAAVAFVALDGNVGVYVAGSPAPSIRICPTTPGAYQPTWSGGAPVICAGRFELNQTSDGQVFYPLKCGKPVSSRPCAGRACYVERDQPTTIASRDF